MIHKLKKQAGQIKRALAGFGHHQFEKVPQIHPEIIRKTIGKSVEGKSIYCYTIGTGKEKILFASGIHGNEVGTVKLAHFLANWLFEKHAKYSRFTFFIIPCLNPDGYANALKNPDFLNGGNIGRFNARGVDLNRNFDTPSFRKESLWSFGKNYSETRKVSCGEFGNSEPETKALTSFIKEAAINLLLIFHNAGKDIVGAYDPVSQKLAQQYAKMCGFRFFQEHEWTGFKQTGTAKEWCEQNQIHFLEIEGSTRWGSDFALQKRAIEELLTDLDY